MRITGLVVCLAGLMAAPAFAQERVSSLPVPPDGFDALQASDATRAYYGFPARPKQAGANGAAALAAWTRAMAAARHYMAPELRLTSRRHGPERLVPQGSLAVPQTLRANAQMVASTNWTGEYLLGSATSFGGSSFNQVEGLWLLPSVQQAGGACYGTDVSAIWVGLDGAGSVSNDVLQAGTEADVTCTVGNATTDIYPWFEWYPDYSYEITNFPLSAGSSVFVSVQATSATAGQAMFVNLQTGAYTTTPITPPAGTRLIGDTAEWILERPSLENNQLGTLADFGVAMMCYQLAQASNVAGSVSPGAPGAGESSDLVWMVNTSDQTIAETAAMGPTGQAFSVQGPTK